MRLIDADALGVGPCNPDVFKHPEYAHGWNSLLDIINDAPTISPDSLRKRGRWIGCEGTEYFKCSNCNDEFFFLDGNPDETRFCPSCGARMDLEG